MIGHCDLIGRRTRKRRQARDQLQGLHCLSFLQTTQTSSSHVALRSYQLGAPELRNTERQLFALASTHFPPLLGVRRCDAQ